MAVKNKLKELRHDFRMDQNDFADFLGVNHSLYNRWEKNRSQPSVEWLLKINSKTGKPIESLMYLDPAE